MNDDSLTEVDDSFFDLYSTKKVTNTFNAVLEKLKSASSINETVPRELNDNIRKKSEDKNEGNVQSPKHDDSSEILVLNECINFVATPEESLGLRRSARLNKKAKNTNQLINNSPQVRRRKNKNISSKRNKKDLDIEIIDEEDSNQLCDDANASLDEEMNYEVSVKIIWKSVSIETFRLRRFQKFRKIFEHFMKEENVPMEKILLSLRTSKIGPNDTPESVNLKVNDFIEGGVLTCGSSISAFSHQQKGCVVVKVQDVDRNIIKFSVDKNESLKSVMIRYAEQIEVPLDKLKFYFDGEILSSSETPDSLGLDSDEIIDVKIMQ